MDEYRAFYEMVKKWTVRDYRTQKIKAEVIIDMLISEFIEEIVEYGLTEGKENKQSADIELVAKEFPISSVIHERLDPDTIEKIKNYKAKTKVSDMGILYNRQYPSVDYLLKKRDGSEFYLVELKTTNDSVSGKQLLNMIKTCENGVVSLYYQFYDVIVNYCIMDHPNDLDTKKYLYTLLNMDDDKCIEAEKERFGETRERARNAKLVQEQLSIAKKILKRKSFLPEMKETSEMEMPSLKIIYLSLDDISNEKIFKEALNDLTDSKISAAYRKFRDKVFVAEPDKDVTISADCKERIYEPIVLKELVKGDKFAKILKNDDKRRKWNKLAEIIRLLLAEKEEWFFMKSKIFHSNDAEYQKFYREMVDKNNAEPGGLGLDEHDLLPFKEFTGCVYVGETEATVGDKQYNPVEMATKEAISKAENFANAQAVYFEIWGSNADMDMMSGAESVICEAAPNAEIVFTVQKDDTLGDTVRVTVVAKIP